MVGILLNPEWSAIWHAFRAPKHRSSTGRVLSLVLPRDPNALPSSKPPSWVVTAVWAPVSTSTTDELDEFWDEVAHETAAEAVTFSPACTLTHALGSHTPHIIAGDWNTQLYEDPSEPNEITGQYRPRARHHTDEYATSKVLSLGSWVHADSHRPALGNRHRGTWYSAIHRKYYEIDWMLLRRNQLSRLVSLTLRHTTGDLQTQHSAKEYVFRLEQSRRHQRMTRSPRPDLTVLRGNSDAAAEARSTLAEEVKQSCTPEMSFTEFRKVVEQKVLTVCGEVKRSSRKPWLRSAAASAAVGSLNSECIHLRQTKRCLQQALHENPDDDDIQQQLEECRHQHNSLKRRQRGLLRSLEKEYWEQVLASHTTQEADSFQFFQSLRSLQNRGVYKAARQNPFGPDEWREHFSTISSQAEFLSDDVKAFIDTMPVSDEVKQRSADLDADISDDEIHAAIRKLRPGAGGGDGVPPVVLKTLHRDPTLAAMICHFVRHLWRTNATQWQSLELDGPGLQVPLWKQKEPFNSMDRWRGVVLLWTIPRVLAKIVNNRGQHWFEHTDLPLSESFGFRKGLGTDDAFWRRRRHPPWAWNVLYSGIVRYALVKRRENAARRGLPCGIPWRWKDTMDLTSGWTRKNDGRDCHTTQVEVTIFADDTTLHGSSIELHNADDRGKSGMDVFADAVADWGSQEHEGKREKHTFGSTTTVCLVGGGISPGEAVNRNIQRGLKCWAKIRPALKNTKLSHKQRGRLLMTFLYSGLAFSCKTRATRQRDMTRMQAVMNTASRYLCRTRLSQMKEQHINHNDLRARLHIPTVQAAMEREQMRWLGHVCRMPPSCNNTYAKTFARGTIEVGDFQRIASSDGGRISADRRSLPDVWITLCRKHGLNEETVEDTARDRVLFLIRDFAHGIDRRVAVTGHLQPMKDVWNFRDSGVVLPKPNLKPSPKLACDGLPLLQKGNPAKFSDIRTKKFIMLDTTSDESQQKKEMHGNTNVTFLVVD
eukprot:s794_g5.t1